MHRAEAIGDDDLFVVRLVLERQEEALVELAKTELLPQLNNMYQAPASRRGIAVRE